MADKYVPYGYHNRDVLYDITSPTLTQKQRCDDNLLRNTSFARREVAVLLDSCGIGEGRSLRWRSDSRFSCIGRCRSEIMAYPTAWFTPPWFGAERFEPNAPWLPLQDQGLGTVDSWGEYGTDG